MHPRRRVLSTWTYKPGLAGDNIGNPFPRLLLLAFLSYPRRFIRAPRRLLECLYIREVLESAVDFVGVKANKGHESSTPIWSREWFRSLRSMFVKSAPPICICMMHKKSLYRPQSRERVEIGFAVRTVKIFVRYPKLIPTVQMLLQ